MNKQNIIQMVKKHHKIFNFLTNIYNCLSLKNRLNKKGVKVKIGVSKISGLKIVNRSKNNKIIINDFVRIKNTKIIIRGNNNTINISDFVVLYEGTFYMEDDNNEIFIGEHTSCLGKFEFATIEGTKILIGKNCLFSSLLHFRTGDSHSILNLDGERINPSQDIVIEDHVWVGTKVTCLKGVLVKKNSIVGATTTLCKIYDEENVAIGGVPGKIIKRGVNWDSKRI